MSLRLPPSVGGRAAAFAALAETILDPVAVVGDHDGAACVRPRAIAGR